MMYELYIRGVKADLGDSNITIKMDSNILGGATSVAKSHSYTITLPRTANNMSLISDSLYPSGSMQSGTKKLPCILLCDGVQVSRAGYCYLLSLNADSIEVCVVWGMGDKLSEYGKKSIRELQSNFNGRFVLNVNEQNRFVTDDLGYILDDICPNKVRYPFFDLGRKERTNTYTPCISVKHILYEIANEINGQEDLCDIDLSELTTACDTLYMPIMNLGNDKHPELQFTVQRPTAYGFSMKEHIAGVNTCNKINKEASGVLFWFPVDVLNDSRITTSLDAYEANNLLDAGGANLYETIFHYQRGTVAFQTDCDCTISYKFRSKVNIGYRDTGASDYKWAYRVVVRDITDRQIKDGKEIGVKRLHEGTLITDIDQCERHQEGTYVYYHQEKDINGTCRVNAGRKIEMYIAVSFGYAEDPLDIPNKDKLVFEFDQGNTTEGENYLKIEHTGNTTYSYTQYKENGQNIYLNTLFPDISYLDFIDTMCLYTGCFLHTDKDGNIKAKSYREMLGNYYSHDKIDIDAFYKNAFGESVDWSDKLIGSDYNESTKAIYTLEGFGQNNYFKFENGDTLEKDGMQIDDDDNKKTVYTKGNIIIDNDYIEKEVDYLDSKINYIPPFGYKNYPMLFVSKKEEEDIGDKDDYAELNKSVGDVIESVDDYGKKKKILVTYSYDSKDDLYLFRAGEGYTVAPIATMQDALKQNSSGLYFLSRIAENANHNMTLLFRLNTYDINNVDFSKAIYLRQYGKYFLIKTITTKDNDICEVELIKI